jgi:hypothetical protein
MDFIDKHDRVGRIAQFLQHRLEALLEVAAILGARQQCPHIQRVNARAFEDFRHIFFNNAPRQAFGDRRLADTGLAHQQRIVLAAAAQRLNDALQFKVASDERIDLAGQSLRIEIQRVALQRAIITGLLFGFGIAVRLRGVAGFVPGDAVHDVIHHINAIDAAFREEMHRVGVLFAEYRGENVRAGHLLLLCGLHMQYRALDDALEADSGLRIHLLFTRNSRRMLINKRCDNLAQLIDIHAARAQHLCGRSIVQHGEQQVLDGNEFMAFLPGLDKRHVQTDFQLLRNHFTFPPYRIVVDVHVVLQMPTPG